MLRAAIRPLLLTGLLMACGGKSFENGGDPNGGSASGGSADAGSSSGGTDSAGTSSGGTSPGGSNSTGGSIGPGGTGAGGWQCMQTNIYNQPGSSIPVRVLNSTSHPIYIGQENPDCGVGALFQVANALGQPVPGVPFCQSTCEQLRSGIPLGCPAIGCALPSVIALDPGGSTMTTWDGLYPEQVELIFGCREQLGQDQCTRIASVPPGDYTFSARAGSNMECLEPIDAGNCGACMKDSSGACTNFNAAIRGPLLQAKVEVKLDGSYGLGGPGGGGMVQEVVIEFD